MTNNMDNNESPRLYLTDFSFSRFYGLKFPIIVTKENFTNRVQVTHLHDFAHIWYCINGSYTHIVGENEYHCPKGSVIIVPPGTSHSLFPDKDTDVTMLSVDISYSAFLNIDTDKYCNMLSRLLLPTFSNDEGISIPNFYQLCESSQKRADILLSDLTLVVPLYNTDNEKILNLLERFFSLPEFVLLENNKKQALNMITTKVFPILDSVHYLNENSSQKIYTKDLMKISILCQTNFCIFFKKLMGMPASIYLQRLRVAKAMFFLAHTNHSIHYISDYCGFNSPTHMIYCFKKHAHTVPKKSRNSFIKYLNEFPERSLFVSID